MNENENENENYNENYNDDDDGHHDHFKLACRSYKHDHYDDYDDGLATTPIRFYLRLLYSNQEQLTHRLAQAYNGWRKGLRQQVNESHGS